MLKVNSSAQARRATPRRLRASLRRALSQASEGVRFFAFLALRVAAHLPKDLAYGAANLVGTFYARSPVGARERKAIARAFPDGDAAGITREWLTRPFRDFVHAVRVVLHKETPSPSQIEFRNAPDALSDPKCAVIIAAGHFSREAMVGLYLRALLPKPMATAIAKVDLRLDPRSLRLRLQLGEIMRGMTLIRDGDVDIFRIGQAGVLGRLVRHLRKPGALIVLASDSMSSRGREGGLDRPFAGHASVSFALGTARLARMSQCSIVTCVPYLEADSRIVVEWGELIAPPARDDDDADIRITNAILDVFERAVGQRPGQYVLPIGSARSWDAGAQVWRSSDASKSVAARGPLEALETN